MPFLPKISNIQYLYFSVTWFFIIAVLSLTPGNYIPPLEFKLISPDTLAHFVFYFLLAYPILGFFQQKNLKYYAFTILFCVLYGIGIEYIQGNFIQGRFYSISDIYANSIGAFGGALTFYFMHKQ